MRARIGSLLAMALMAGCNNPPLPIAPSPLQPTPKSTLAAIQVTGTLDDTGQSSQFRATAVYANGTTADVTTESFWTSTNFLRAIVTPGGIVTAQGPGPVEITATLEGVSGSLRVLIGGPGTYIMYLSEPGDPVGQGLVGARFGTTDWVRAIREDANRVSMLYERFSGVHLPEGRDQQSPNQTTNSFNWEIQFAAPQGQGLAAGVYDNTLLWPLQPPDRPQLRVWIHRLCDQQTGRFVIHQVVFSGASIQKFDASFEQRCKGSTASMRGKVAFNR